MVFNLIYQGYPSISPFKGRLCRRFRRRCRLGAANARISERPPRPAAFSCFPFCFWAVFLPSWGMPGFRQELGFSFMETARFQRDMTVWRLRLSPFRLSTLLVPIRAISNASSKNQVGLGWWFRWVVWGTPAFLLIRGRLRIDLDNMCRAHHTHMLSHCTTALHIRMLSHVKKACMSYTFRYSYPLDCHNTLPLLRLPVMFSPKRVHKNQHAGLKKGPKCQSCCAAACM